MATKLNKIKHLYKNFESFFSSVKFAVLIISIFALFLTIGTFLESYHGAVYANKTIYKSWWFMLVQALMFTSILMATLVRLPLKKRLHGFYTVHLGLMVMFGGSLITYLVGIDGSIQLTPKSASRKIIINEDQLVIHSLKNKRKYVLQLPYKATPTILNEELSFGLKLLDYYPSSESKLSWKKSNADTKILSASYLIFNDNVAENVTLSLNPVADYQSNKKLGPLTFHLMPKELLECFLLNNPSKYIIWYTSKAKCSTPEKENISIQKTDKGNKFLVLTDNNKKYKFLPEFTPLPVNDDLTKQEDSPIRILSLELFLKKPHLFLFGKRVAYYKKRAKKWISKTFDHSNMIKLPWMGFQLKLLKTSDEAYPLDMPYYQKPIQDNNELIAGTQQALKVGIGGEEYWLTEQRPLQLASEQGKIFIQFSKKTYELPYQLALKEFVMKRNPGTNDPASFESYIELLDGRKQNGLKNYHVYMNNPLKYDDFTFYQSSYFQAGTDNQGRPEYASVLSVNYDPGRKFKYLGSILIVFGSIWHFVLRKRKRKA